MHMKKVFLLLMAAGGALSAMAQGPSADNSKNDKKNFTKDADLQHWVVDVNLLGGALMQDLTTAKTDANYLNGVNINTGGNLKFSNGVSYGFDAQLGYFFGRSCHFGIGAGFMYLAQQGDLTMDSKYHVEYQATDFNNNIYRQEISSTQAIKEKLQVTNMNIPILLKYKTRFSKRLGFTADLGAIINLQLRNEYSTNAAFDYEAIYKYTSGTGDHTGQPTVYDNSPTPNANDVFYTKAEYTRVNPNLNVQQYFNDLHNRGYNVGLGVKPNSNSGSVSYAVGSVGFLVQPSLNYFLSDNVALNIGVYYLYQPFSNTAQSNYMLTDKTGAYSSVMNTVTASNNQSFGGNIGVRFFFGKPKDTDGDGIPDKKDKCPLVYGLPQFQGCPDSDGDGIPDAEDSCPHTPGLVKFHGCPDSDGDGIPDKDDACPYQAGLPQFHGCPDRDGDGIPDKDDLCPDKPGLAIYHGCPDTDGDGVPDNEDKCPDVAGPADNHGCPYPAPPPPPEDDKISTPIMFEVNKTVIHKSSYPTLDEAYRRLNEDKESYIIVDGYTDITGKPAYNKKLSLRRAAAVKAHLVKMGVSAKRIKIVGHGANGPVGDNSTKEGRMLNRRAVMKLNVGE